MSFVASPQAHSTSIEADATTKPFFDHEPIEGFFNTIDVKRTLRRAHWVLRFAECDADGSEIRQRVKIK